MVDIIGKRYWYFLLSLLVIIPGLVAMGIHWSQHGTPFALAIDYTGGTNWEFANVSKLPSTDEVRALFAQQGIRDAVPQPEKINGNDAVLIRSSEVSTGARTILKPQLIQLMGQSATEVRFESAGPAIGAEVSQAATAAVAIAAVAILVYLTIAFRKLPKAFRYGVCAIIAMLHDILVVIGAASLFGLLFGWEVDALFLTALLTVIGFSVHDTIVVFDRIRENLIRLRGLPFEQVVNQSILQTLDRSINTQLTVLFTLTALVLFGGITIHQFALTLLIGILSGTYSSIFNASPLLVVWENGEIGQFFRKLFGGKRQATA
ncbi:MAG: protein translocase subunit SecF [Anaerolineae bacterium]